ncbi:hypothetical protein LWE69_19985 [Paenibacillus sp. UKAQ_18]|nr:hypothetical protein [Paenibacillus sp. UKAQ_18]
MKKLIVPVLSASLLIASLSPVVASAETVVQNPDTSAVSQELITPQANSGWETKNGITARVYTDRNGDVPVSDSYIGVTGEKTAAGGTIYYYYYLVNIDTDRVVAESNPSSFSSTSPQSRFPIDNLLNKGQSGNFQIMMKLFSDSNYDNWIGDWYTPSFKVSN